MNGESDNLPDPYVSQFEKVFQNAENIRSAVTYQCIECRIVRYAETTTRL